MHCGYLDLPFHFIPHLIVMSDLILSGRAGSLPPPTAWISPLGAPWVAAAAYGPQDRRHPAILLAQSRYGGPQTQP